MRPSSLLAPLLSFVLPLTVVADSHALNQARHHHDLARRASGDVQLHKRFSNARLTFYDVGLGACGKTNQANDFIVALNADQFGSGYPGPNCFKQITIHCHGKTASATIMDRCPGCPFGGLDLSRGLFTFFASESEGVLSAEWEFSGGGGDKPKDPPKPVVEQKPKPTPKPSPKITHSSSAKKTSSSSSSSKKSSSKKSSSSVHHKATTTSTTTTPLNLNKGPASGLAVPTGTIKPNDPQGINGMNQAIIGMGGVVSAGRNIS